MHLLLDDIPEREREKWGEKGSLLLLQLYGGASVILINRKGEALAMDTIYTVGSSTANDKEFVRSAGIDPSKHTYPFKASVIPLAVRAISDSASLLPHRGGIDQPRIRIPMESGAHLPGPHVIQNMPTAGTCPLSLFLSVPGSEWSDRLPWNQVVRNFADTVSDSTSSRQRPTVYVIPSEPFSHRSESNVSARWYYQTDLRPISQFTHNSHIRCSGQLAYYFFIVYSYFFFSSIRSLNVF